MSYIVKNINLFELTRQIFGITAKVDTTINFNERPVVYDVNQIKTVDAALSIGTSPLNTPIIETIAIKHPISGEMVYFADAPLIEVSLRKNIVKSEVNKRPGTVKEYINRDDYQIGIKGLLCNQDSAELPHDRMRELAEILVEGVALEVESRLLNSLSIYNIVIEDFRFQPNQDYTNIAPYTVRAISDAPIELDLDTPQIKDTASFQTSIL